MVLVGRGLRELVSVWYRKKGFEGIGFCVVLVGRGLREFKTASFHHSLVRTPVSFVVQWMNKEPSMPLLVFVTVFDC